MAELLPWLAVLGAELGGLTGAYFAVAGRVPDDLDARRRARRTRGGGRHARR